MKELLDQLEPKLLWSYFLQLSRIPRGSGAEAAAARWVADQGRALGCWVEQDAVGNVLIRKAATPGREDRPGVALQAHVDMVCEKNESTVHDFLKDPIEVVRDGELLRARGTTLGADNGIGVASALAALASPDLVHGPLEVLVTIDEETGLTGANNLRPGWLQAKYLLNLDSEAEGEVTIGCAGGIDTIATRKLALEPAMAGGQAFRLKVAGLKGGHSGLDINRGRGNSIRILAQLLRLLLELPGVELAALAGGNKRNAIPREATALLQLGETAVAPVQQRLREAEQAMQVALGAFDPGLVCTLEPYGEAITQVWTTAEARRVVNFLLALPHGVTAMSPAIPELVQTSTNLGLAGVKNGVLEVCLLSRSSIDSSKRLLAQRIAAICELADFEAANTAGYPGWKPDPGALLVQQIDRVQQELFGRPMKIIAIHAGLECGIIGEKYPGMEMASIGPSMWDVHTPDEHVSIPSVANFWRLLRGILAAL